ncbi:MAG TPA: PaaI family thioesterase [Ktedonobacterales bacterium]|nr:PaaI family thioesterase [Ktedonobacterales bacterium]
MEQRAFQDQLAEVGFEHCWGCGSHNEHGLQIKSFWDGDEGVCDWQAKPYHQAWPGIVNGGILATIIDCHCASVATAAAYRAEQRALTTPPLIPYVTGSLSIAYLRPTPITAPLHLRARVKEQSGRKMMLTCALSANGDVCVRAEAVMVRLPTPSGTGS